CKQSAIFDGAFARFGQRDVGARTQANMACATVATITKNPSARAPLADLQVKSMAASITAVLGKTLDLALCGKSFHGPSGKQLKFSFGPCCPPGCLQISRSTGGNAWEVPGRQKREKCRWDLANLQRLGTPRNPSA